VSEIGEDIVERTWQRCANLQPGAARREMDQVARQQPDLLEFVRETTADLSLAAHELAIFLFFVVFQTFRAGTQGKVPRVKAPAIMRKLERNGTLFDRLGGADKRFLERTALSEISQQPSLIRYVVEALMEAPDDEDDPIPLSDEESGLLFLVIKTVIDVLDEAQNPVGEVRAAVSDNVTSIASDSDLVLRSGVLKEALVDFAGQRRFAREVRRARERRFGSRREMSESEATNFFDGFILQHRLPDGKTVVEHFVAEHTELPEVERAMLLGWRDAIEGIFEVQRQEDGAVVAVNLVDELPYRIRSNMGPAALGPLRPHTFLVTRLVPVGNEWILSGMANLLTAADRAAAYEMAAQLLAERPQLAFRNPAKLAQAWEQQRAEHRSFVEFFGADLVIIPGDQVAERLRAYLHFRQFEVRDADGKTAAERAREIYGTDPPEIDFQLPPDLADIDTVGLVVDDVEGFFIFPDLGPVAETFTNPDLATDQRHQEAVREHLMEPRISPVPLRHLAALDPERASRVFQQVLRRPDFVWEHDGEALLRQYKASFFDRPALPGVTVVSGALAHAQHAAVLPRTPARLQSARSRGKKKRTKRR
jgi:hypothetical protein